MVVSSKLKLLHRECEKYSKLDKYLLFYLLYFQRIDLIRKEYFLMIYENQHIALYNCNKAKAIM